MNKRGFRYRVIVWFLAAGILSLFVASCPVPGTNPASGTVTVRITNLTEFIGKEFICLESPVESDGSSFTDPFGYQATVTIASATVEVTLYDTYSEDESPMEFAGGELHALGGYIDMVDEAGGQPVAPGVDYITIAENIEIDGDMVIEFSFPDDFIIAGPGDSLNGSIAPPSGLSVEPASGNSVSLQWNDDSPNETGFCIEYKEAGDAEYPAENRQYVADGQTSTEIEELSPSTSYDLRMYAYGFPGNSEYSLSATGSTAAGTRKHVLIDWFYLGTEVAGADFDGDGDIDFAGTAFDGEYPSNSRADLVWFRNDGTSTYPEYTIKEDLTGAWLLRVLDFDGDGDQDVAAVAYYDDVISWFENDGTGSFTEHVVASGFADPCSLEPVDIDGDGQLDLLAAGDDSVCWFRNIGEGFTQGTLPDTFYGYWIINADDLDGDGETDIIIAGNSQLLWYENDGSENFSSHQFDGDSDGGKALDTGDVDGDGDVDIISSGRQYITLYENSGTGTFTAATIYDAGSTTSNYHSVELSDLDGDGDLDVSGPFVTNDSATLLWLENDGTGGYAYREIATDFYYGRHTDAVDFDGDGDQDLLSADQVRITWWEMGY